MKIALLNLPVDNNYGGNLQRYALIKVLTDLGNDVTHICLLFKATLPWYKYPFVYLKRIVLRFVLGKPISLRLEQEINDLYRKKLSTTLPFYESYVKHTKICYNIKDVKHECDGEFDLFIVGSDQVWRKDMGRSIGWDNFLFAFLPDSSKRIAYGISFGTEVMDYNIIEKRLFSRLYSKFKAVSVREKSALSLLERMGCKSPLPQLVLDPTLLLYKEDYMALFYNIDTFTQTKDKIFCYILDMNEDVKDLILAKSNEMNMDIIVSGISNNDVLSIQEWLKSIYDANYIITDSYHGVVFSILFNKQFLFCGNKRRGNTRVASICELLAINEFTDYEETNRLIDKYRQESFEFLEKSIK